MSPTHNQSGPLEWRRVVEWLRADGVISAEQAQRTIARCSQAESSQHPLVRLGNVSMVRASDGKPLDVDMLTEYVAQRCGMAFLRIDPLKVDVGRVADAMSASYAERHKVLPVQVTAKEVVVATAEPFVQDWVAEVERRARRSVRRVLANPWTSRATRPSSMRWPSRCARRRRPAAARAVAASSSSSSWAGPTSSSTPTTRA